MSEKERAATCRAVSNIYMNFVNNESKSAEAEFQRKLNGLLLFFSVIVISTIQIPRSVYWTRNSTHTHTRVRCVVTIRSSVCACVYVRICLLYPARFVCPEKKNRREENTFRSKAVEAVVEVEINSHKVHRTQISSATSHKYNELFSTHTFAPRVPWPC